MDGWTDWLSDMADWWMDKWNDWLTDSLTHWLSLTDWLTDWLTGKWRVTDSKLINRPLTKTGGPNKWPTHWLTTDWLKTDWSTEKLIQNKIDNWIFLSIAQLLQRKTNLHWFEKVTGYYALNFIRWTIFQNVLFSYKNHQDRWCVRVIIIKHERQCFMGIFTLRRELKIRWWGAYFWQNSKCLDSWWNTISSIWYFWEV